MEHLITPTAISAPDRFLTRQEVAEMLGLSSQTLAKWAQMKTGPKFTRLNARVLRYKLSDVQQFIAEAPTVGHTEDAVQEN